MIEGDHGSTYFYCDSPAAHAAYQCQVTMQREAGGNALIGRQVYPLLVEAGFEAVRVSPRMVYVDATPASPRRWVHEEDVHHDDRGHSRMPLLRRVSSRRSASMTASAISTERPRRTACSAIRSSRAWGRRGEAPDRREVRETEAECTD